MLSGGWVPCDSSAVAAYLYEPDRAVLQIRFVEGDEFYEYPCPAALHDRFLRADSKGTFVNTVLKPYAQERGVTVRAHPWVGR